MDMMNYNDIVRLNVMTFDTVFDPERCFSQLDICEYVRVCVVTEGSGFHVIMNEPLECRVGDMFILGSGVPMGFFARDAQAKLTVHILTLDPVRLFDAPWSDQADAKFCYGVFRNQIPISYALLNSQIMHVFLDTTQSIALELKGNNMEWQSALKAKVALLFIELSRYIHMAQTAPVERNEEWRTVATAMRLVSDRCADSHLTLESIAAELYVSQSNLSRLFQKVTGDTFADYVRKLRMSIACRLLRTTALTNEQIVNRCGLKDVPSFYRMFKKHMGMTPYQYRMLQQNFEGEYVMEIIVEISENVQRGKAKLVKELVQQAIDQGFSANVILNQGLLAGMNVIGEKFKNNEVYVPDVLVTARAMNMGVQILKPLLVEDGVQATGKVCIGTVQGDLHDIGKNLVKMMMEGKGLEVIDLGTDVTPETFVQTAIEQNCQVICCSALLTTTMEVMEEVVKCAEQAGIRDKIKIMIGGSPVTESFCQAIGADVYTEDAASAADAAVELCK